MIQSIQDILLVCDLDGTLLTDDKTLLSCNIEALRLFRQLGGRFTVATGRVFESVTKYPELLPLMEPGIASGGAVIYDYREDRPIKMAMLPRLAAHRVLAEFHAAFPFLGSMVAGNNNRLYQTVGNAYTQILFDDENLRYYLCPEEDLPRDWNKILFAAAAEQLRQVHEYARAHSYPGISFVSSEERYFEALPEGVSKGAALLELCNILGVPPENAVVIGDYYNDVEMMQAAGRAIAMANAPEDVQRIAGETTLSCNDGGVGHAVYRLIREYGG